MKYSIRKAGGEVGYRYDNGIKANLWYAYYRNEGKQHYVGDFRIKYYKPLTQIFL